jgi:hypothetical protein
VTAIDAVKREAESLQNPLEVAKGDWRAGLNEALVEFGCFDH